MEHKGLVRFLDAQNQVYLKALSEIKDGLKQSHWMWFIFPQLKGLGKSENAIFYGITNLEEAVDYLAHPVLGKHLIEVTEVLLQLNGKSATEIFGASDDIKLRSSMTLFAHITDSESIFDQVLQKYFDGLHDENTLEILDKNKHSSETAFK